MNTTNDILESTYESAATMTSAFAEHGNGNMGEGVRRAIATTYSEGHQTGVQTGRIEAGLCIFCVELAIGAVIGIKLYLDKHKEQQKMEQHKTVDLATEKILEEIKKPEMEVQNIYNFEAENQNVSV